MPKNCGSNWSISSRKPPRRVMDLPGNPASASKYRLMFQRSAGMSPTASRPSTRSFQKASELLTPPGKRQPVPMMAMRSFDMKLGSATRPHRG